MYAMGTLNCLTYNVRGLNSPEKSNKVLREIKRYSANIIFLQETLIAQDTNIKLYSNFFPTWYYGDSPIRRAKGVAIGLGKDVSFRLEDRKVDPEGQFLFLKDNFQGMECTLANVYCPNKIPKIYMKEILSK